MSGEQPLVSVIIIFLNEEAFLREAIESVFAQSDDRWELLLVDDGSSDGSTEIARGFAARHAERVRYLEHEGHVNRGMSSSRNLGIRQARGKYVALLDGDDVWLPQKLERQVAILESQPETGMLYGPTEYWHSWTGLPEDQARDYLPELCVPMDTLVQPPELLTVLYPLGSAPAPCLCSLLVRTDLIRRIGGFEDSFGGFYEDQAFLTKVYLNTPVFVSSGRWDRYRIHSGSCSAVTERTGQYAAFRRKFLEWLQQYLRSLGVTDATIWKAVYGALRSCGMAPPGRSGASGELTSMQSVDPWIEAVVKGKSFIDVGGLWGTVNEKVTVAARAGATRVTMMDICPLDNYLWEKFTARCAEAGVAGYHCLTGNLDDADVSEATGVVDVVHCSGVLYHCPNPVHTIGQLARMCGETLIITTTIVPEHVRNVRGELTLPTGSVLFVPALTEQQREVLSEYWNEVGAKACGLNVPVPGGWRLDDDYGPWWWLFTVDFVPALLRVAGFDVIERGLTWNDHVGVYLARRRPAQVRE